jgi:hypothetical protein
MSAKSILEADGKAILNYHLTRAPVIKPTPLPAAATHNPPPKLASLHFPADADVRGVLDQAEASSKKGDAHGIGLTGDMGEGLVKYLFFGDIRCAYVGP